MKIICLTFYLRTKFKNSYYIRVQCEEKQITVSLSASDWFNLIYENDMRWQKSENENSTIFHAYPLEEGQEEIPGQDNITFLRQIEEHIFEKANTTSTKAPDIADFSGLH